MKSEHIHEQRQSAGRMEAVMLLASIVGAITAIVVFFTHGWLPSLALFFLSLIAYALSRVLDLIADLLYSAGQSEERPEQNQSVKDKNTP